MLSTAQSGGSIGAGSNEGDFSTLPSSSTYNVELLGVRLRSTSVKDIYNKAYSNTFVAVTTGLC